MMGDHVCGGGASSGGGAASNPATSIDAFTPLYKGIHDKISVPPVDTAMASPSIALLTSPFLQITDIQYRSQLFAAAIDTTQLFQWLKKCVA